MIRAPGQSMHKLEKEAVNEVTAVIIPFTIIIFSFHNNF